MTASPPNRGAAEEAHAPAAGSSATETEFTNKQVASGSTWTVIAFGLASAFRLGSSVVLTRIFPDPTSVYGVMALVFAFYTGLLLFSDFGIGLLLTQDPRGMEPAFRHTAFTAQILRGFLIWLAAIALAPVVASAYADFQGLQELLTATAFCAVIGGFSSTSIPALRRQMRVATVAKLELGAQLFGTAATITHALLSPTAWAMVSGSLATAAFKVVVSHWLNDSRDRIRWDKDAVFKLRTVGRWVFLSTALTFCADHADRLLFGQLTTKEQLGVYAVALVFPQTTAQLIKSLCMNVLYPVLCQAERLGASAEDIFLQYRRPIVAAGGILFTFLAGAGVALMELLYTEEFSQGGWMMQVLACGAWFHAALGFPRIQAAISKAKPKYSAIAQWMMIVSMAIFIPLGDMAIGFPGAVCGFAIAQVARYATAITLSKRLGIHALRQDLLLTLLMAAAASTCYLFEGYLRELGANAFARCFLTGCITLVFWAPLSVRALRDFRQARKLTG